MIPDHFYITGLGLVVYAVLYVPLSFALAMGVNALLRRFWKSSRKRLATVLLFGLFIAGLPMLEVYAISRDAEHLCREQAGLKVYRVVEAEGFLGDSSIEIWSRRGFRYVESGGTLNRKFRDSMKDGKVVSEQVSEYMSRYQSKTGDNNVVIGSHLSRSSHQVIDRQTSEVLGQLVVLSIYPGWLDNIAIALSGTGSGFSPWHCGDEPSPGSEVLRIGGADVVLATIKPTSSNGEASK